MKTNPQPSPVADDTHVTHKPSVAMDIHVPSKPEEMVLCDCPKRGKYKEFDERFPDSWWWSVAVIEESRQIEAIRQIKEFHSQALVNERERVVEEIWNHEDISNVFLEGVGANSLKKILSKYLTPTTGEKGDL